MTETNIILKDTNFIKIYIDPKDRIVDALNGKYKFIHRVRFKEFKEHINMDTKKYIFKGLEFEDREKFKDNVFQHNISTFLIFHNSNIIEVDVRYIMNRYLIEYDEFGVVLQIPKED